jgi:hypothetical protein
MVKMKGYPAMLLKTKGETRARRLDPAMSLRKNQLSRAGDEVVLIRRPPGVSDSQNEGISYDVIENKGKREGDGGDILGSR